jgi:hypothetical protein
MMRTMLTSLRGLPLLLAIGCAPQLTVGEKDPIDGEGGERSYQNGDEKPGQAGKGGSTSGNANVFTCADQKAQIALSLVCNGKAECPDASDEKACPTPAFSCKDGQELHPSLVCNGKLECKDGSDELNCQAPTTPPAFACKDGTLLHPSLVCNGKKECGFEGEDEAGCPSEPFICEDGTKLDASQLCNGEKDCVGADDEVECGGWLHRCNVGKGSGLILLISAEQICDGKQQCPEGDDELDCDRVFYCKDGPKLPASQVCDGLMQCPGYEDELNCSSEGVPEKCADGVVTALPFDVKQGCWRGIFPVACSEVVEPTESVPDFVDNNLCVKRKRDGALLGAVGPMSPNSFENCSPEERKLTAGATSCP